MKQLLFATNNEYKLEEVRNILGDYYEILSLKDIGDDTDIPETGDTLEENAMIKANYLWNKHGLSCFADDTGLEVEALNNAPGVYSARYAGEEKSSVANMEKVLSQLDNTTNRKARFRTVIALIDEGKKYLFEGKIEGIITEFPRGKAGFGYDPIFQPEGYEQTFAELGNEEKNKISHRAKAVQQLALFLSRK